MNKQNKPDVLGLIVAFAADSYEQANNFANLLNAETSGKVLSLTKTYDGYWISIDSGSDEDEYMIFDTWKDCSGIKLACVIPSTEKLLGNEVIGFEDSSRSLIRMILQLPDPEADSKDFPKAA